MLERALGILTDLWASFIGILPNIVGAIIVFFIGWIIAKILARVVRKVLSSIGLDKLAEKLNQIELVEKTKMKIVPSRIFSKIIYYILLLIFAIVAAEILQFEAVTNLVLDILNYIPNLIAAIIVLAIGLLLGDFIKNIVLTTMKSLGIPSAKIIASFVFYFIVLMTVVTALTQMGIDTDFISNNLTVILAGGVFAFGLGYGLASKNTMSNFLASFYTKDKFKIGDRITLDEVTGEIVSMDSSTLTILTGDSRRVIIPLHKLTHEKIEIHS
ncbi:MAG: mechanosensitive ion channel [Saprospiraceae bacterium]|nr:mechanosensitive ion channel [Saprospiraceae bacterium]